MSPQDPNAENWSDSDSWLDDQLRAVPLPKGFAERLRWASLVDDEDLDEAVRDVPLPAGLLGRLRLLARRRHPLARLSDLATAVSLLVAIGVSYVGAMVLLLMAVHASRFDTRPQLASQTDRIELEMARLEPAEAASLGKGLWSTMYGFIALDSDLNTVKSFGFYDQAETPGLGGEVDSDKFKKNWVDKKAFDEQGAPVIAVIKGTVDKTNPNAVHQIDGISGATITCDGVSRLVQFWLGEKGYGKFLEKLQAEIDKG